MKKIKKTIALLLFSVITCVQSCGPSRQEIENVQKQKFSKMRYKIGQVVYLKPDSCVALIMNYEVSCFGFNNCDSSECIYNVRDCHGNNVDMKKEFIYGLKN